MDCKAQPKINLKHHLFITNEIVTFIYNLKTTRIMSTHSRLSLRLPNGKARSIHCHSDGYPDHQLVILTEHYTTLEKVEELMALGDLSYLQPRVKPNPDEKHSWAEPAKGVTIAYHRDRGTPLRNGRYDGVTRQQYNYVFNGIEWRME